MAGWIEKSVNEGHASSEHHWVEDSEGEIMLPTIFKNGTVVPTYWAGFSNIQPDFHYKRKAELLDYEFIYEPIDIKDMIGKQWKTTRKNIHKIQREHGELKMDGVNSITAEMISDLVDEWAQAEWMDKEKDTIQDADVMTDYLLKGQNRRTLWIGNEFVGMWVWDENWKYINFRYCILKPYPGLSDYARILFRCKANKLINDGGSLDRDELYKYKERLNPVEINKIYTTL